ncbi:MAG TPA: tyrosine-type recombinase/integrase [Steroidobacteraceae bacterium]|nr:tyrosine-type recombinase/integrase [Steroidobacteraceae bacterium]
MGVREAAGVKSFRFHDLRHSAATYLAREGASEQQLKAIGGWKSGVVSRYVHLAATETRNIVQKMNEKILGK